MAQKLYYNGIFSENNIKLVRDVINVVSLDKMQSRTFSQQ